MMGPVVILGGSGLLGQALLAACARRGRAAVGVSRRTGVDLAALATVDALAGHLDPLQPSLLINAAAITDLEQCERDPAVAGWLHARLPALLAGWAQRSGTPWVQVSTDHYFSGNENRLHDEAAPVTLLNEYARGKYAGESAALASAQALVVRTNIVGRRGWPGQPSFAEWAVQALQGPAPVSAYTDAWASSLEAGQCANALLDLSERGARGLLNVGARESISKADFIAGLADALGLPAGKLQRQPRPQGGLPRANSLGLDVRRAEALLGRQLPGSSAVAAALALVFKEQIHVPA